MASLAKDVDSPTSLLDANGNITSKQHNIIVDRLGGEGSLTGDRVLTTDVNGDMVVSSVNTTTLSYLDPTSSLQTQLNGKQSSLGFTPENSANKNISNGYCPLDSSSKTPITNIPTGTSSITVCIGNDSRLSDSRTPLSHTHPQSEITNLVTDLSNKSAVGHIHSISDVTSLQTTLDAKYSASNRQGSIVNTEISNVDASKVTTGQFVMARLASGTPDGTKFIRDDGVLASVAGGSTNIKQTEVDFGTTPVYDTTFTVTDVDVSTTSQIITSLAYEAPTGKDLDELEFDDSLSIICKPATGSFDMKIHSMDGTYLADKFKINYLIG